MIAELDKVWEFAEIKLEEAMEGASVIPFAVVENSFSKSAESRGTIRASASIEDIPRFRVLKHGTGQLAWAVILSVDMRASSSRAERVGAQNTYLTMHTYLPTMAYIVEKSGGSVIGLRGDGLFAGFGITEVDGDRQVFTQQIGERASGESVRCGRGMIEAIEDVINPLFSYHDVPDGIEIGVGIDFGHVVITRIGIDNANELTAYGKAVNRACKKSDGCNQIWLSNDVKRMFPTGKGGMVKFSFGRKRNAFLVESYPYDVLERKSGGLRRGKSR